MMMKIGLLLCVVMAILHAQAELPLLGAGNVGSTSPSWSPLNYTCANTGASSASSSTCNWSTTVPAHASVFCQVSNFTNVATFSVSDSAGNVYSANGSVQHSVSVAQYQQFFYFSNLPASVTSVTMTVATGTGSFPSVACNASNGGPIAGVDGTNCFVIATGTVSCGPIVTSVSGDYIFCGGLSIGGSTLTIGTGFTAGSSGAPDVLNEYLIQVAAGSITPTMTVSTGNQMLYCSAYKP